MDRKEKCSECNWFNPLPQTVPDGKWKGECHGSPPIRPGDVSGQWPIVLASDFCGTWKAKPKGGKA